MTQTVNNKNSSEPRKGRPGQRQQERLIRIERRKRRRQITLGTSIAVVLIALVALGFWEYHQVTTQQEAAALAAKNQKATATAKVKNQEATATENVAAPTQTAAANAAATTTARATATALNQAVMTATSGSPTPPAGPASPPAVSGKTVTLSGGLKYIDIKTGTGPAAQSGNTVQVEYTGWLASSGKKFDSSYDHQGQAYPVTLGQGQVIPGWDQGLVGMQAGGTRRLLIPASLAYGASGKAPIPPNADLIFDVTVLTVQ